MTLQRIYFVTSLEMEWSYEEFEHAVGLGGEFHPHIRAYSPTPRTLLTSTLAKLMVHFKVKFCSR